MSIIYTYLHFKERKETQDMLNFDVRISKKLLASRMNHELNRIFENNEFDSNGIKIKMKLNGNAEINILDLNIRLDVPLDFYLKKDAALFSVEGHGSIKLQFSINYNFASDLKLITKTDLISHEWIEAPVLDFGAIDLPVTTLVNLMLKHYESILTSQIDQAVAQNLNLHSIAEQYLSLINKVIDEKNSTTIKTHFDINEIVLSKPNSNPEYVNINGAVQTSIQVGGNLSNPHPKTKLNFRWTENIATDNITLANINISYDNLCSVVKKIMNEQEYGGQRIETSNCHIAYSNGIITINADLLKPLKGKATISASLIYVEAESMLHASNIDIDITPESFLYKLTAPLVSNYVESMIEDNFPLDINKLINKVWEDQLQNVKDIDNVSLAISGQSAKLKDLIFTEKGIVGNLQASNLKVDVTLQD
jgi:hypothetical protein